MSKLTQAPETAATAPLDHVVQVSSCLIVADLDRAVDWYGRALDLAPVSSLDIAERGERVAFLRRGPIGLELAERRGSAALRRADPPEHGFVQGPSHISFHVDDLDATLAALAERGALPVVGPVDVPPLGLRVAFLRDVEDNLLEFLQHVPA